MNKKQIEAIYPLVPQQQGMLFDYLLANETGVQGVHIEQFACVLRGPLNIAAFTQSWQRAVECYTILRTAFAWKDQDEPLQVVLRQVEVVIEQQDWRDRTAAEQQRQLQEYLSADRQRGFELAMPPLMRLAIFQLSETSHQFVWTFHHILLDGWSQALVLNDVFACYQALTTGRTPQMRPSPPYRNYVAWLKKQDLDQTQQFWREALHGFSTPTPLGIPADFDEQPDETERYGYHEARLSAATTQRLQAVAQQRRLTMSTLVQGAWALVLSRYSRQQDVMLGVTVSGRPPSLPNVEAMIGLFISSLPLRLRLDPEASVGSWLATVQAQQQRIQEYGYCTAGQIHRWLGLAGLVPLYESLVVFENYPVGAAASSPAELSVEIGNTQFIGAQTNHALTLLVTAEAELRFQLVYDRRRVMSADMPRLLEHCLAVLERIADDPAQPVAALLQQIPAAEIPRFKPLDLALTPNVETPFVAPRTPTEEQLARIWAEVLGIERVGIHHSFFELGGYSLLAAEIVGRIRSAFQVELLMRHLFEAPTIADLALVIAQKQAEQADDALLDEILAELEAQPQEDASMLTAQNSLTAKGSAHE